MEDIKKMVPTNDELRAIIEKIAAFLKAFLQLFDKLQAGLVETFSKYERVLTTPTDAEAE